MAEQPSYSPLDGRPLKDTICLFDVDNTLTPARGVSTAPAHMNREHTQNRQKHS